MLENFQHLFEIEFCETSQNFNWFSSFLKKIFFKHCQYQNKKALFTDPIFSEGFGANLVGPKIEKLSQCWLLMVPYPVKKYAFDFIKNSTPLCERDICNSWMALHNFVHPLSSSQWGESLSEGTNFYVHAPSLRYLWNNNKGYILI